MFATLQSWRMRALYFLRAPTHKTRRRVPNAIQDPYQIYEWIARARSGLTVRGRIFAREWGHVRAGLAQQGYVNIRIHKRHASGKLRALKTDQLTQMTRQLATLLRAGVALLQALEIILDGAQHWEVKRVVYQLRLDISSGSSLAEACSRQPKIFSALYCGLIYAGETAGVLDKMLDALATHQEKIQGVQSKVKKALFYPTAIIAVAFLVVTIIMLFVIPSFKELFAGFNADLPLMTQMVVSLSEAFVQWWWLIFGSLIMASWLIRRLLRTSRTARLWRDRISLKLPILGPILYQAAMARWCRTLSTILAAGVPIVDALEATGRSVGNLVFTAHTRAIRTEVSTGTNLTAALERTRFFEGMPLQMISIGEQSGALDDMLSRVAKVYEEAVDLAVDGLSSLMEPVIMAVLGTLIGGLVVALYLPIFKMGQVV